MSKSMLNPYLKLTILKMFAGASDVNILGQVATWNYSDHLDVFPGTCGKVEGVGDFFSPNLDNAKSAELYSNDLCRPIVLNYSKPVRLNIFDVNNLGWFVERLDRNSGCDRIFIIGIYKFRHTPKSDLEVQQTALWSVLLPHIP